ncbi:DNA/RNA polymerases superfamily protein [Gossypium australe]|uniref:DNA/RNA polymerases superfamily protein n=1 Tax=Gossypium australe TaxID=47621 RepID=A0A5B6WSR4_9ROSI|nr:DNA/RNA polymerases superfamily protein [Gossypium australe]
MLRDCIIDLESGWECYVLVPKFVDNNSSQMSIQMAPYEALYGQWCRTPLCWSELSKKKIKSYADIKWKDVEYDVGDNVFLKVSLWKKLSHFSLKEKLIKGSIEVQPYLSYEEELVGILARKVIKLRKMSVISKILWRSHSIEEATKEPEETMRS